MIARRATLGRKLEAEAEAAVACVEEEHVYARYEREQLRQASGGLRWASKDVLKGSSSTIHLELDLAVVSLRQGIIPNSPFVSAGLGGGLTEAQFPMSSEALSMR